MKINYIPEAEEEFDQKLERIALRPYTSHSIADFIQDINGLEQEILSHPGLRKVSGAREGFFRTGPSPVYSYVLIYQLHDGDAFVIALVAPGRRPHYWSRRKI